MRYLRPCDPHVHLRGGEYPEHDFATWAYSDADAVGLTAICAMPNCKPFLTTVENVQARNKEINLIKNGIFPASGLSVFTHLGLTTDMDLNRKVLPYILKNEDKVVADKVFYCHSTGNMGILDPELQKAIWKLKAELGYTGVSIGHFEDATFFTGKFDPADPVSHSRYQNEDAETESVETQLRNATDAGFRGTFYVAHVSSPMTVEFLHKARSFTPFKIVMEATFHHMFLDTSDYKIHGNLVKMNPPLREMSGIKMSPLPTILNDVLNGLIDVIGTDHAPHPIERKRDEKSPASGIPALPFWPRGIELLQKAGISQSRLDDVTFHNANNIFKLGLQSTQVETDYKKTLWTKYGYNPFSRYDNE